MNVFKKADIPDVVLKNAKINNISIRKAGNVFELYEDNLPWMLYDPRPHRKVGLQQQFAMYDLAYGKLLITGFGFGVLLNWLCKKPEVTEITIIEKHKEVVDLYLLNNELPTNKVINIIYADANTYTTDIHYDCLFLDHLDHEPDMVATTKIIAKHIPHDVLWFWPLENIYAQQAYKVESLIDYFVYPHKYEKLDFGSKWQDFRKQLGLFTIPEITNEQMAYYVNVYANNVDDA